jgi:transposase
MEMLRVAGNIEEVEAAYQAQAGKLEAEKLLAIKLGMSAKHTTTEIAHILSKSRGAISQWVKAFREGGIPALLTKKERSGRPASLNQRHQEILRQGLEEGRWRTALEAHEALKQAGCPVKLNDVYYWLHKLDGTLKVPRKSHVKKMPQHRMRSNLSWKQTFSK